MNEGESATILRVIFNSKHYNTQMIHNKIHTICPSFSPEYNKMVVDKFMRHVQLTTSLHHYGAYNSCNIVLLCVCQCMIL